MLRSAEQLVGVARSLPSADAELVSIVVAMIAFGVSVVPWLSVHLAPCSKMLAIKYCHWWEESYSEGQKSC